MDKISQIKAHYNIRDLAIQFGANPNKRGLCKHNPTRAEKTSSLVIYEETNSFNDFGGEGGDVIDFYSLATGKSKTDSINELFEQMGGNIEATPIQREVKIVEKSYMTPNAVAKAFSTFSNINHKDHKEILDSIAPEYLYKECTDFDYDNFFENVKYCSTNNTAVALLFGLDGLAHTFRYRNKLVGDEIKKWVALRDTKSSYLYVNLTKQDNICLIVEGTRDYLTASLAGFNVIALPSANFKEIPSDILIDRKCIFIDDDDGKESMKELYEKTICEKIWFNHKDFKEITKCNSKDFSDYLYQFKSLVEFKEVFVNFINSVKADEYDWQETIKKLIQETTLEDIKNAENQEWLFDNVLIKRNITTIFAPPNTGKSALVFGMIGKLLDEDKIDNVFFFDPDSPLGYVKPKIENLKEKYADRFKYYNGFKSTPLEMIEALKTMAILGNGYGKNSLIICDGLQFFISGKISDDHLVKPFMESLKNVRDKFEATICLLHHSKREKNETGEAQYLGSQIIETATDNMILLDIGKDESSIKVTHKKSRSDRKNKSYNIKINLANSNINDVEDWKNEEIEDEQLEISANSIYDFLCKTDKPYDNNIIRVFGRDKKSSIMRILDDNVGKLWLREKGLYNSYRYEIIEKKEVPEVIEFDEKEYELFDMF